MDVQDKIFWNIAVISYCTGLFVQYLIDTQRPIWGFLICAIVGGYMAFRIPKIIKKHE